jgi:hypothetical protein
MGINGVIVGINTAVLLAVTRLDTLIAGWVRMGLDLAGITVNDTGMVVEIVPESQGRITNPSSALWFW